MNKFYQDVNEKQKNKKMRLQTDIGFQQTKIKNLNKKFNVGMFSASFRGGKAITAKQKIGELKINYFDL